MAISSGAAILGGSLISGGLGAGASSAQGKAGKKALAEQTRQFDLSRADLAPYREVGSAALEQLASALGIEGYRTPEELAHTRYLKTRPGAPGTDWKTYADKGTKMIAEHPAYQEPGKGMPDAMYAGAVNLSGFGALTDIAFRGASKKKKKAAAQAAADQAAYQKRLSDWEAEAARLKTAADTSIASYDPAAATRARLETDPGYGFRLSEGEKALERSQAATTGVLGGRAVKEGLRYNQDYASNEYTNYINRLAAAAGIGQATSTTSAGIAAASGPANAGLINQIGSSKAGAYSAANNAVQGGLSNYMTMSMYDQLLKGNKAA